MKHFSCTGECEIHVSRRLIKERASLGYRSMDSVNY